jgi:hypothetical protein
VLPVEPGAVLLSKAATQLMGPLHGLVALWLNGRTATATATITKLPIRTVLAVCKGLENLEVAFASKDDVWNLTPFAKSTAAAAFLQRMGQPLQAKPQAVGPHKTARQVFKARKRSAAQQLRRRPVAASSQSRFGVVGN